MEGCCTNHAKQCSDTYFCLFCILMRQAHYQLRPQSMLLLFSIIFRQTGVHSLCCCSFDVIKTSADLIIFSVFTAFSSYSKLFPSEWFPCGLITASLVILILLEVGCILGGPVFSAPYK